jgi:hypothetical protein
MNKTNNYKLTRFFDFLKVIPLYLIILVITFKHISSENIIFIHCKPLIN